NRLSNGPTDFIQAVNLKTARVRGALPGFVRPSASWRDQRHFRTGFAAEPHAQNASSGGHLNRLFDWANPPAMAWTLRGFIRLGIGFGCVLATAACDDSGSDSEGAPTGSSTSGGMSNYMTVPIPFENGWAPLNDVGI